MLAVLEPLVLRGLTEMSLVVVVVAVNVFSLLSMSKQEHTQSLSVLVARRYLTVFRHLFRYSVLVHVAAVVEVERLATHISPFVQVVLAEVFKVKVLRVSGMQA